METDPLAVQKAALNKADDIIDRLSGDQISSRLFTTEFKDRFLDEIRAYDLFLRSQTAQDANEAIVAIFERTMTRLNIEDQIKAPLRTAFALQLQSTP